MSESTPSQDIQPQDIQTTAEADIIPRDTGLNKIWYLLGGIAIGAAGTIGLAAYISERDGGCEAGGDSTEPLALPEGEDNNRTVEPT